MTFFITEIFHVFHFSIMALFFFLINIYSNSSQSALKYLKNTEVNLTNVLIMTGNFNIRNSIWDLYFLHHSSYSDTLFEITDSFQIELSKPIKFSPTRFTDNAWNSNSVLDLIFLYPNFQEFDNHYIHSDWRLSLDHVPISIDISIIKKYLQTKK